MAPPRRIAEATQSQPIHRIHNPKLKPYGIIVDLQYLHCPLKC